MRAGLTGRKGTIRAVPEVARPEPKRRRLQRPRLARRLFGAMYDADSYGLVLVLILVTYLLTVTLTSSRAHSVILLVQMATVWLAFRTSRVHRAALRVTDVLLVIAGIAAIAGLFVTASVGSRAVVIGLSCILYLVAPPVIVRHVFTRKVVDLETVLGAIAAYLLIGMFFAFAYRWLGLVQSGAFFGSNGDGTAPDDLFFSFTTMTTVGYGNLVPGGNPGQTLAVFEMVSGQLFLIIAVTKAVSGWRPELRRSQALAEDSSPPRP